MEVTRTVVRAAAFIFGPLVLMSYVYGISRMTEPNLLWGGIPESMRGFNVFCMFIAAIGFLIIWWMFLYQWDAENVQQLNWPWKEPAEGGYARLLLCFMLVMIPSMLWLEMTRYHIMNPAGWTPYATIGILIIVAIANIMLGLLSWEAWNSKIGTLPWLPFVGSIMFSIQVIFNDAIWWSIVFPWEK